MALKHIISEEIRQDEVVQLLKDLWLSEKYARAVLVQRVLELV